MTEVAVFSYLLLVVASELAMPHTSSPKLSPGPTEATWASDVKLLLLLKLLWKLLARLR